MVALDSTLGALFLGIVFASILYGVTCIQAWYYFINYTKDPWYIKLLVLAASVSDTIHEALIIHLFYTYVITYFGVFAQLENLVWSMMIAVYVNGFTSFIVQCFLCWRIYKLCSRKWLAPVSAMVLVIAEFILVLVYCAKGVHMKTYTELKALKSLSMSVNIATAVGDIYIAVLLCYLLHKSRTGFRRSDSMINKLVAFTINSGLLTSCCALASLVCITIWPNAFIYIAFYFSIGRLYCNTLLGTLNARKSLRGESEDDSIPLSHHSRKTTTMLGAASNFTPNNISIRIDTVHDRLEDEHDTRNGDNKNPEEF